MRKLLFLLIAIACTSCSDGPSQEVHREDLFAGLINRVPELRDLLTVDEIGAGLRKLRKDNSEVVELEAIRPGDGSEPTYVVSIGNGERHVLLYAGATGAEPFGSVALAYLLESFAADARLVDESNITWHVVVSLSPDEALRNEEWYKELPDVSNLAASLSSVPIETGSGVATSRSFSVLQKLTEQYPISLVVGLRSSIMGAAQIVANRSMGGEEEHFANILTSQGIHWEAPALRGFRRDMSALDGSLERYMEARGDKTPVAEVWLPYFVERGSLEDEISEDNKFDHQELIEYLSGASERMAPLITVDSIYPKSFETYLSYYRELVDREQGTEVERELYGAIAIGQLVKVLELEKIRGVAPFPTLAEGELTDARFWFEKSTDHIELYHSYTVTALQNMVQTYLLVALHLTLVDTEG